jgi:hypothetical protein
MKPQPWNDWKLNKSVGMSALAGIVIAVVEGWSFGVQAAIIITAIYFIAVPLSLIHGYVIGFYRGSESEMLRRIFHHAHDHDYFIDPKLWDRATVVDGEVEEST